MASYGIQNNLNFSQALQAHWPPAYLISSSSARAPATVTSYLMVAAGLWHELSLCVEYSALITLQYSALCGILDPLFSGPSLLIRV